jgi:hypothetical protein
MAQAIRRILGAQVSVAKEAISQVGGCVSGLALALAPPRQRQRMQGQDPPVVSFRVVILAAAVLTPIALVLVSLAFAPVAPDFPTIVDASRPAVGTKCGMAHGPLWLVVALGMSSGLSSVNPIQSGLLLGF